MQFKSLLFKLKSFATGIWHSANSYKLSSESLLLQLKNQATNDLNQYEHKVYSQFGEDGIIEEIFHRIGTTNQCFLEIGSGSGLENNSVNLLLNNWTGYWIDADPHYASLYEKYFSDSISKGELKFLIEKISSENINQIIERLNPPKELDLLSIDVDGNDYYIWDALTSVSPRVVIIEYNGVHTARSNFLQKETEEFWPGGNFFGASIKRLAELGTKKGYTLVACNLSGNNAFFVKSDLIQNKFTNAGVVEKLYQPARYYLNFYAGSYPDIGKWAK